jgi:hypothetical protein
MDLDGFAHSFGDILWSSTSIEMNCHWMLPGCDGDDGRRGAEECGIRCEVGNTKGGGHYYETKRLNQMTFKLDKSTMFQGKEDIGKPLSPLCPPSTSPLATSQHGSIHQSEYPCSCFFHVPRPQR